VLARQGGDGALGNAPDYVVPARPPPKPSKSRQWTVSSLLWGFGEVEKEDGRVLEARVMVVKRQWVMDCLEQGRILPVGESYVVR
jgi:hypothetical protein